MTYIELKQALQKNEEVEFCYNGLDYGFINRTFQGDGIYWYLLCDEINFEYRICGFEENKKLLDFLETYLINNKTIRQIFEEGLNC